MKIKDTFKIDDEPSGLRLSVEKGINLDHLHVEIIGQPSIKNRDFFFTKEGDFDGTGSAITGSCPEVAELAASCPGEGIVGHPELERAAKKEVSGGGSAKPLQMAVERDPWAHRSEGMRCFCCMFYVPKVIPGPGLEPAGHAPIGRCRRHAPTMGGYPAVFPRDWCGDHKVDEGKV